MSSSINLGCKFLFYLLFPVIAHAAEPFCNDPARVICNQKEIVSDQGVSKVARGIAIVRKTDRLPIKERALRALGTKDLDTLSYSQLSALAKLLRLEGWRCYLSVLPACRAQIAERIAEYASREVMLFEDERPKLAQTLSLREVERARQLPIYKSYLAWLRKDAATFRRNPALERRLTAMFPEMVQSFIAKVRSWPVPEPQKSGMIKRLQGLSFVINYPDRCADDVPAPYTPNANYNAGLNQVTICSGMFIASTSVSSLAVIVAHEIAHTVGPCFYNQFSPATSQISTANLERVYGGLLKCLQDRNHVTAGGYCTKPSIVNESFADWAGAELAADYLPREYPTNESSKWRSRFAGAWSFTCGDTGDGAHPANVVRINELLFANPRVRSLINCPRVPERECRMGSPMPRSGSGSGSHSGSRKARGLK